MLSFAPGPALWQRDVVSLPLTSSNVSSGFKSYPLVFNPMSPECPVPMSGALCQSTVGHAILSVQHPGLCWVSASIHYP